MMAPRRTVALALLTSIVAVILVAPGCGGRGGPALTSGQARGANILLVTIDTLRKDRVGAFGSDRGLTPNVDRVAAAGIRYSNAFSHVPETLPAHTSIMTGLTPRHHGVRNNTSFRLDDRVPTLAAMLKSAGYRTGAFIGAFVLDARFGLNRGFDEYDDRIGHARQTSFRLAKRPGADVVQAAGDWILQPSVGSQPPMRGPWFAWVHLFDPHAPYDVPPGARVDVPPYDAEVAYADAMIGRFLDRLRVAHALERTLIVVTADHGESLGEHGEMTHGLFAYNATIAVPLIVAGTDIHAGTIDAPVAHIDLTPTILDLAGVPVPDGLDGRSLVRPPGRDRPLYFEAVDAALTRGWAPLTGIVQNSTKFIDLPDAELYDLVADPAETINRVRSDPRAEILQRALPLVAGPETSAPSASLDAEASGRLRSLGYVGGSSHAHKVPTAADDPKRLVGLNEQFAAALTAFDQGRASEALSAFLSILESRPDFLSARTGAATVLLTMGKNADAVHLLRGAPSEQSDDGDLLAKLGAALREAGDLKGAAAAFERARSVGNQNPGVLNDLAVTYAALGRSADARALFDVQLSRAPRSETTWFNLGLFELQRGRRADAAAALRHAVEIAPSYGEAWYALGSALVDTDRRAAVEAWRKAEPLLPGNYDLLFNLGMLLADGDTPADAAVYLRRFVAEAPRERYGADIARVRSTLARLER
jgi:arylsulfatase A-like enzyme/Flp pilus assembly protein TadD